MLDIYDTFIPAHNAKIMKIKSVKYLFVSKRTESKTTSQMPEK